MNIYYPTEKRPDSEQETEPIWLLFFELSLKKTRTGKYSYDDLYFQKNWLLSEKSTSIPRAVSETLMAVWMLKETDAPRKAHFPMLQLLKLY